MRNRHEILYPMGVTQTETGTVILLRAACREASLILKGADGTCETIDFPEKDRVGDVWKLAIPARDLSGYTYQFEADGKRMADPCARILKDRGRWNDASRAGTVPWAAFQTEDFDWGDERRPELPYSETILYRLHVRGFTKHASSKVTERGTYAGLAEKIPYLKELGVTSLVLLPVTEFDEIMMSQAEAGRPDAHPEPTGVTNYWGYGPSFLYALKAAYGSGKTSPEREFKELVRRLHEERMECIPEVYLTGAEAPGEVVQALRYWVEEYHVDGFWLSGYAPVEAAANDPFLKRTKLFAEGIGAVAEKQNGWRYPEPGDGVVTVREKNLAEWGSRFQDDMRRFLKGDEGMIPSLEYLTRRNPADYAVVNYMDSTNGFTLMDLVSYERKHNEKNGEDNRDGSDYNYSWNCGIEGPSRKKKILELRRSQLANAYLLMFLSQGVPMILAGDEFGNSQDGNNNAYCQDNEISWINWKLLDTNREMYRFVKGLIAFRKAHPVFHMEREPRIMDYKSCGRPDISYHGENAWRPEYENFRRQFGILYWGAYGKRADGSDDSCFYVAYNMHWEPHVFGLPRLNEGDLWYSVYDTSHGFADGEMPEREVQVLKNQIQTVIPPRSIRVFEGRRASGYYVYNSPVGELTVVCEKGAVTGLYYGRRKPEGAGMEEARTELSDLVFAQLEEYFNGTRKTFDLPLAPEGTEFQKKVWDALHKIPYGETRSYREIAAAIGDEKATRAVGMANNRNPIAILIPCHRVIGANGSLTGYAGGLEAKKWLLEVEKKYKE